MHGGAPDLHGRVARPRPRRRNALPTAAQPIARHAHHAYHAPTPATQYTACTCESSAPCWPPGPRSPIFLLHRRPDLPATARAARAWQPGPSAPARPPPAANLAPLPCPPQLPTLPTAAPLALMTACSVCSFVTTAGKRRADRLIVILLDAAPHLSPKLTPRATDARRTRTAIPKRWLVPRSAWVALQLHMLDPSPVLVRTPRRTCCLTCCLGRALSFSS